MHISNDLLFILPLYSPSAFYRRVSHRLVDGDWPVPEELVRQNRGCEWISRGLEGRCASLWSTEIPLPDRRGVRLLRRYVRIVILWILVCGLSRGKEICAYVLSGPLFNVLSIVFTIVSFSLSLPLGKLRAILDYDDLKPEVFQNFREIGNSIAFLHDLSDLLEVQEQFDFVLIAPFLGVGPSGGKLVMLLMFVSCCGEHHVGSVVEWITWCLKYPKSNRQTQYHNAFAGTTTATTGPAPSTNANTTSSSPLLRVVNHLSQELKNNPRLAQDSLRAQDVWSRLPAVMTRLCESAMTVAGPSQEAEGKSGTFSFSFAIFLQTKFD